MRTRITLDPDVRDLLNEAANLSGRSFDATLNNAVRAALGPRRGQAVAAPDWPCFDMGAPLVNLTKATTLADELVDSVQMPSRP